MIKKEAGEYQRVTSDALCWSCEYSTNGALCCWADGEERNDWIVIKERGGITVILCGGYKREWIRTTVAQIAKMLGVCERTIYKYNTDYIIAKLQRAGYKTKVVYTAVGKRRFYIKNIADKAPLGQNRR